MLLITTLILLTMFFLSEFTLAWAIDESSLNDNGALFSASFTNISGSYSIPELGFKIKLPSVLEWDRFKKRRDGFTYWDKS